MDHSFDMGAIFTKGVPYLSREEEATARETFMRSQDKSTQVPDLIIPQSDIEALNFYNTARETIFAFSKQKKVCRRFLDSRSVSVLRQWGIYVLDCPDTFGVL
jgi:CAF1 family ribonuclease